MKRARELKKKLQIDMHTHAKKQQRQQPKNETKISYVFLYAKVALRMQFMNKVGVYRHFHLI